MTAKTILKGFEQYEKARIQFVQSVADLSTRPQSADCLIDLGAIELLSPLLSDIVPNVQVFAALALGRLANHKLSIAQAMVDKGVLPKLLQGIDNKSKHYKKSAMFLLRCITKHSAELAEVIVTNGGLDAIIHCAEHFDPVIKEAAAWALGNIAKHNMELARSVEKAGGVSVLVLCLQEPELCLKQVAVSALCDISKHSVELAQCVLDARCVAHLVRSISNPDPKLKKQVFLTLSNICKHSMELTEAVVEPGIIPEALLHLGHPDVQVNRGAAMIIREIVKHSLQLSQLVVDSGGLGPIIELATRTKGTIRLPALIALGFIAGHSEALALAVIESQGVPLLASVLMEEEEDHVLSAAAWAIFCIGKHSPLHSRSIAAANIFPRLIHLLQSPDSSEDLKVKCKTCLKLCIHKSTDIDALEPLLPVAPPEILKYIIIQYSRILPGDARARRLFATSGSLRKIQQIEAEPGSVLMECIEIINCCYPEEMIRFYSPNYPELLLHQLDTYMPQVPSILTPHRRTTLDQDVEPITLPPPEDKL